ncbi:MAG: hypothetical protein A2Z30_02995 [Chloroflexi bacterium RBG_16_64_43]|nr:MAG: hypothetical protein A2Z30_02995 [Chloroflexi bacterium RBG_16_64_43]
MPFSTQPDDEFTFSRALDPMAAHMEAASASRALRVARAVRDAGARARALAVLSRAVPEDERLALLGEALSAARSIGDPWRRVRALMPAALRMPEQAREMLAREVFQAVMNIQGDWLRGRALSMLRRLATAEVRRQALQAARALKAHNERISALCAYAGDLPPDELERLLAQVESIPDEWLRQSLLASLAEHLPRPALERAVDLARRLHGTPRALALAELGLALPDWGPLLREEALADARNLAQPSERAEALTELMAGMPAESHAALAGEALAAARAVSDPLIRAALLADLIEFLPARDGTAVVGEAGLAARGITDPILRAEHLSRLIPYLGEAERPLAIGEVLSLFEDSA